MEHHNAAVCGLQAGAQWSPGRCRVQAPVKGSRHMTKRAGSSAQEAKASPSLHCVLVWVGEGLVSDAAGREMGEEMRSVLLSNPLLRCLVLMWAV